MKKHEYDEIPTYYGKKVRERRKSIKMTQIELAEITKLHNAYISSLEKGERNVSIINMVKIAKALKWPVKNFFPEI